MSTRTTIQLREFCRLFAIPDREIRYILESGHVPAGIDHNLGTGRRREFGPGQAFWLAIVLLLKTNGIKTALAAEVADFGCEALRTITQNLSWHWRFHPELGWFDTDRHYYLDVGDLEYLRLVTDSNPSHDGLYEFEWFPVGQRRPVKNFEPYVTLRVDLGRIAAVLDRVGGWARPEDAVRCSEETRRGRRPKA